MTESSWTRDGNGAGQVLIVDDDRKNLCRLERALISTSARVTAVSTGVAAFSAAAREVSEPSWRVVRCPASRDDCERSVLAARAMMAELLLGSCPDSSAHLQLRLAENCLREARSGALGCCRTLHWRYPPERSYGARPQSRSDTLRFGSKIQVACRARASLSMYILRAMPEEGN